MAVKSIAYIIERSGFEKDIFTEASPERLVWPDAVNFAREHGGVLQSVREAAAFRIEASGAYDANDYQATRTTAVYFIENNGVEWVAFDDDDSPERNIVLAKAKQGFESHSRYDRFLLPKSNDLVSALLKRADKAGRIVELPKSNLKLSVAGCKRSGFAKNTTVSTVFGDVAADYAVFLNSLDVKKVYFSMLGCGSLEGFGVNRNNVEVRPVGLGGDHNIGDVYASNQFYYSGRSRGKCK